ncbi:TIGR02449 family protein [Candidatus Vondammii sp. HM_W22]|uniref:TIGR02449 family protein n=1 Tax=Candidatus Vondammii sp. HM_W22 TaxID=2687299 RepID=UPI001F129C3E|nr:TIGR02449 family protein [Candidatus Vondammii sp. HM_W22]
MRVEDQNTGTELDLRRLEVRVDELIRNLTRITEENRNLRGKQDDLIAERAKLIEKTELAKSRVEAMITRLKSMETHP